MLIKTKTDDTMKHSTDRLLHDLFPRLRSDCNCMGDHNIIFAMNF